MDEREPVLKSLSVEPGKLSPGFGLARKVFTVYVPSRVDAIAVHAEVAEAGDKLTVNGAPAKEGGTSLDLTVGRNSVEVKVASANGESTYMVKVIRAAATPNWKRVAEQNKWIPRDSTGEMVFKDQMWLIGGYTPPLVNDVWRSEDGKSWTEAGKIPCEGGVNIPPTWVYRDRMWVVSQVGRLFSSENGEKWDLVLDQAPWSGRYGAGAVVFDGRMWLMGGIGSGKVHNDVWSSTDGVNWTLEVEHAAWSGRQLYSMVTAFDGKMWIVGGGISTYHPFRAYNDVWCSSDGVTWEQVTENAPWPPRVWTTVTVYRDRLWLMGGFRAEPTWNNFDDVWYSANGVDWHRLETESIWTARHEYAAYVFDEKLWVVGGNAWPLMNDAWHLEIQGLTFVTQPKVEEFVTAQYSYRARADFNVSRKSVRYRLTELEIDGETGLVRGTPGQVEDVKVTIEAYDEDGETARQSYMLHVIPV
ncbi:MAG: cadherin-like beta sandwich domain-containing protein [bacterium]|nr:cadherin-like beta sandwich domain-containing protein [bacterium]